MALDIDILDESQEEAYRDFQTSSPTMLVSVSLPYRSFLKKVMSGSRDLYLTARQGGRIVGALPSFLVESPNHGRVLNSLPFFGTPGGVFVSKKANEPEKVRRDLVRAFDEIARGYSVLTSTLIANPLESEGSHYDQYASYDLLDRRIGQFIRLHWNLKDPEEIQKALMKSFHPYARRNVRKALKSGVETLHDGSMEVLRELSEIHKENMAAIGGRAKPWSVFQAIFQTFTYDTDYRVYVAQKDGATIAALLLFFWNRTTEYFVPVTRLAFRELQPMSLLVYLAMQEAVKRRCLFWNWGGTWLSQSGVYRFKSRFGTTDNEYRYYVKVYDDRVFQQSKESLLESFPYCYVLPFDRLTAPAGAQGSDPSGGPEADDRK